MRVSDFDYGLPKELIAQYPLTERDSCRMLVVERSTGRFTHRAFRDIVEYLRPADALVLNDTRVMPSRLFGRRKTGGTVELLLLKRTSGNVFRVLMRPSRLRAGEEILFDEGHLCATILSRHEVAFNEDDPARIYSVGRMPLPPYVKRPAEAIDEQYYQTVYADQEGAVAAPTAGLHFTRELLDTIAQNGVGVVPVTLHVGPGTFRPVRAEDVSGHTMEEEEFRISARALEEIREARQRGGRIWAVGTTSVRALESASGGLSEGSTGLFIYPGYVFKTVDCLVTNFHLPRTTLLMLVAAFCGRQLMLRAYEEAVRERYRFYSYGDAMVII